MQNLIQKTSDWIIFLISVAFFSAVAYETGFLPPHKFLPSIIFDYMLFSIAALHLVFIISAREFRQYLNWRKNYRTFFLALFLSLFLFDIQNPTLQFALLATKILLTLQGIISLTSRISVLIRFRIRPPLLLAGSFSILISIGTALLMMPNSTTQSIRLVDAFFTAVSAVCVTGLIVVDTATHFTVLGKTIIFGLFQIGGFGIVLLSYFLISLVRMNVSLQERIFFQEFLTTKTSTPLSQSLKMIFIFIITIELTGTMLIWSAWFSDFPMLEGFLYAAFHAVSAFCNAGFSLFSDGLMDARARENPTIILTIASLIFLGSIGFLTKFEVVQKFLHFIKGRKFRLSLTSRIVLIVSVLAIISAGGFFWLLENNTTLAGKSTSYKALHSLFQSVTLRTAGFNTLDFSGFLPATLLLMTIYMFIGGSSISTAGGVKINTLVAVVLSVRMTLRNDTMVNIGKRRIPFQAVNKATTILFSAFLVLLAAIIGLCITDSKLAAENLSFIIFEAVSALGTVGLSSGITPELSDSGKLILCIEMFVGRVGPLTMAMLLTKPEKFVDYDFPDEDFLVG